jgi:hypothetical protein
METTGLTAVSVSDWAKAEILINNWNVKKLQSHVRFITALIKVLFHQKCTI